MLLPQAKGTDSGQGCFSVGQRPPRKSLRWQRSSKASSSLLTQSTGRDGDLLTNIEEEVKSKQEKESSTGKGFGKPTPKPKKKQAQTGQTSKPQSGFAKPYEDQLNRELNTADKVEETIVRALAFLFIVFFGEGVFLAIAGFLPEAWDNFAVDYVYPVFTPTLGLFLAISIVYGLLKTRQSEK